MRGVSGVRVPAGVYVSGQATGWPGSVAIQRCLQAHIEGLCHDCPVSPVGSWTIVQ